LPLGNAKAGERLTADDARLHNPELDIRRSLRAEEPQPRRLYQKMSEENNVSQENPSEEPQQLTFVDVASVFFNQAVMSLGRIPHPMTGEPFVSFEAAQESIAVLEILETKTTGNLDEEESRVLETMISELKLLFVQCVKDPQTRDLADKVKAAAERKPESKIITPDGRPASSEGDGPRIIIP
jgi:uncharacterized protein DUF1844